MQLIIGLGNPGKAYEPTRHNVGFWLVDAWAERVGASFALESKFRAQLADYSVRGRLMRLAKPQTYMNLSGESVQALCRFYQIPSDQLLIIHDELDLPAGVIKLKWGGGHAGHNGLKSIEQHLGTRDFWRLRVGIGRPAHPQMEAADYVLGKPTAAEMPRLMQAIDEGLEMREAMEKGEMDRARQWLHSAESARLEHGKKSLPSAKPSNP